MVSLVGDTLLDWMNRGRGNDEVLDQITKNRRCLLLGGYGGRQRPKPPLRSDIEFRFYAKRNYTEKN